MKELDTICTLGVKEFYIKSKVDIKSEPDRNYELKEDMKKLDANCKVDDDFLIKSKINFKPEIDRSYETNTGINGAEVKSKLDKEYFYMQSKIDIKLKRDVNYETKLDTNKINVYKKDINLEAYKNRCHNKEDPDNSYQGNSDVTAADLLSEGNVIFKTCENYFDIKSEVDVKSEPEDNYELNEAVVEAKTETSYPSIQYSEVASDNIVNNGRKRLFFQMQDSGCPIVQVKKLKIGDKKDFPTDAGNSERMGKSTRRKSMRLNQLEEEEEQSADEALKKFTCTKSKYVTNRNKRFNHRLKSAHNGILKKLSQAGGYYKCSYCDYETDRRFRLKAHLLKHETKEETFQPTSGHSSGVKKYKCSECDFETMYNANLKVHYARKHSRTNRFRCSVCNYETYFKSRLKAHMLIHARDGVTFADNESGGLGCSEAPVKTLRKYQRTCYNKKLKCSECGFETSSNHLYEAHVKCHSLIIFNSSLAFESSNLYKCSECPFRTHIKGNLKRHLVIHSDSKLFKCSKCLFETNYRFVLKRHTCSMRSQSGNGPDTLTPKSTKIQPFTRYECRFQSSSNADMKRQYSLVHSKGNCFSSVKVEEDTNEEEAEEITIENSKRNDEFTGELIAKAPYSIPLEDVKYVDKIFEENISVHEDPHNNVTHGYTVQYQELTALETTGQEDVVLATISSEDTIQQNYNITHTEYSEQHRGKDNANDENKVSEYNKERWEFSCCYCKYKTYHSETLKTHQLTHELRNFSLVESNFATKVAHLPGEPLGVGTYLHQNEIEADIIRLHTSASDFENGEITYWLPETVERSFELSFNKF